MLQYTHSIIVPVAPIRSFIGCDFASRHQKYILQLWALWLQMQVAIAVVISAVRSSTGQIFCEHGAFMEEVIMKLIIANVKETKRSQAPSSTAPYGHPRTLMEERLVGASCQTQ